MKKYILRIVALLILASAILPSCSVEYRERRHRNYYHHEREYDHHYHNY